MERYIALLRGINVSGKNKIAMSELKAGFVELGYTAVSTHLNSGNVIFLAFSYDEFYNEVGNPKDEYEKAYNYKNAIFWSFSRKDYQKTNWWSKTARSSVSDKITIRTANTVRKVVGI